MSQRRTASTGSALSAVALVCALVSLWGCSVSGLNFSQDKRVVITTPVDRAKVTLPVTVKWQHHDFKVTGRDGNRRVDSGYFGVLVDRPPQPPGKTLAWIVRNDQFCRQDPTCPNDEFLARFGINSTTQTSFTIENLVDPTPEDDRREFHEVIVVLLNGRGERIGESAFSIEFELERET